MPLTLGLDLGTTSISAIAVDDAGSVRCVETVANDAARAVASGRAEQDPLRIRQRAMACLATVAAKVRGERLTGLGLTGQMHGVLLCDAGSRPVSPLITWQDRRALERPASDPRGPHFLDRLLARTDDDLLRRSGCRFAAGYLGTTLYTLRQQHALPAEPWRASLLVDWLAASLCDKTWLVTDPSNAASTGLFDVSLGQWSDRLLAAAEVEASRLPEVRPSGAILGGLAREVATLCELPVGLPVCNAIGDNQAAILGSVPAGLPTIQINVGTGGQINWPLPAFARLPGMDTRPLPIDRLMVVGAGLSGGDAFAWVNHTVRHWLQAFGVARSSDEVYRRLMELAVEESQRDGLECEPLFRGTRRQPMARGSFTGIGYDNFTVGRVARAVLWGIAEGFHALWREGMTAWRTQGLGDEIDASRPLIGSGNGLRQNPLLVAAIREKFSRRVLFAAHPEEAAYGAALLAGVSTAMWPDLPTAGRCIRHIEAG